MVPRTKTGVWTREPCVRSKLRCVNKRLTSKVSHLLGVMNTHGIRVSSLSRRVLLGDLEKKGYRTVDLPRGMMLASEVKT